MATYTKLYTLNFSSGGDTVYEGCDKLEDNVDQLVSNLNTCHTSARGDLIYKGATAVAALTVGAAGAILSSNGTDPGWIAVGTQGDLIVRGASALSALNVGTNGQYLKSDGTDPGWSHMYRTTAISADLNPTTLAHDVLLVNTDAARAINLGTAATVNGKVLVVKDSDGTGAGTNNITISTQGTEKIDGADTYVLNADRESVTLVSNGTNWFVVSAYKE